MLVRDPRGVTWTMGAKVSAGRFFAAMDSYFTFRAAAMDRVDSLLRDDPEVPAGWVLRGYLLIFPRLGSNMPAAAGAHARAEAASRIAVPLSEALAARMAGDPDPATDRLLAARFAFPYMGGSNAQRDILDIYLIDCAIASGDSALSRRLLHEYLDLRLGSVPMQARLSDLEAARGTVDKINPSPDRQAPYKGKEPCGLR